MVIVALSGGKASAYSAKLAIEKYGIDNVELYFNDTLWEHKDLYRFINELSVFFNKKIVNDSLGISVEELFVQQQTIANNRMPFCSRILKAERLYNYYRANDLIVFGIGKTEKHRAKRIIDVYKNVALQKKKPVKIKFPLLEKSIDRNQIDLWLNDIGIKQPKLYDLGFQHNNCSGGCIRAGKIQWVHLFFNLPEVFEDRNRMEKRLRKITGKNISILKGITLDELKQKIINNELPKFYLETRQKWLRNAKLKKEYFFQECIGICYSQN